MRILYLSQSYVPSRRANGVQVMKQCAAFARLGHRVELVSKRSRARSEPSVDDLFAFYGVPAGFTVRPLPRPAFKGGGLVFSAAVAARLLAARDGTDLVYSRDLPGASLAARSGLPVIYEAHGPPAAGVATKLLTGLYARSAFRRLVVISARLESILGERGLLPGAGRVVVAHDAADPGPEPEPRRRRAGAALEIGYVGSLFAGRGIELVAELAGRMPEHRFHVVGGDEPAVERWRRAAARPNLTFHGFVEPARLPQRYAALDVLLMPYQPVVRTAAGTSDIGPFLSPMKMFEYMAAGRPIVASDLPVLREVLSHERNALLAPPAEASAWQAALDRLAAAPELAATLARAARRDLVAHHTFDARARRVLDGL